MLRMVVKENFNRDLADKLLKDIGNVIKDLEENPPGAIAKELKGMGQTKSHGIC